MAYEFRLPADISARTPEGFVVNWFKEEGQLVDAGQLLVEVQFEKAVFELDAPVGGVLAKILSPQGSVVRPGQPLCLIEERVASGPPGLGPTAGPGQAPGETPGETREVRASPAARRLAREMGVPLEAVVGSGPGGRITEEDVRSFARKRAGGEAAPTEPVSRGPGASRPVPAPSTGTTPAGVRVPMRASQQVVAEIMLRSLRDTAQFTLVREVDVSRLVAVRENLRQAGSPATVTDIVHRVVVLALLEHPDMQAVLDGEELLIPGEVHLGFAVARGDDLLVPVIRSAHQMSLLQLAGERQRLTRAVHDGNIRPDELNGATFTVTNLGTYGIDIFTPVLNPPQPAILGTGRIRRVLVPSDEGPRAVHSMALSLTVDHRVINGACGARFLERISDLVAKADAVVDGAATVSTEPPGG